jgi:hypothetical protein
VAWRDGLAHQTDVASEGPAELIDTAANQQAIIQDLTERLVLVEERTQANSHDLSNRAEQLEFTLAWTQGLIREQDAIIQDLRRRLEDFSVKSQTLIGLLETAAERQQEQTRLLMEARAATRTGATALESYIALKREVPGLDENLQRFFEDLRTNCFLCAPSMTIRHQLSDKHEKRQEDNPVFAAEAVGTRLEALERLHKKATRDGA